MAEVLALPEGHDRVDVPRVADPVDVGIRPAAAPVETGRAVGVDDQAGRDEARDDLVVDGGENLRVQGHQPVDLEGRQRLAGGDQLLANPGNGHTILRVPEAADVQKCGGQLRLQTRVRFAARVVVHGPPILGHVVRVLVAPQGHLVRDDPLDDLAVGHQTFAQCHRDTRGLVRASMVGEVGQYGRNVLGSEAKVEPLLPLPELVGVLVDRCPVDDRDQRPNRLVHLGRQRGVLDDAGDVSVREACRGQHALELDLLANGGVVEAGHDGSLPFSCCRRLTR